MDNRFHYPPLDRNTVNPADLHSEPFSSEAFENLCDGLADHTDAPLAALPHLWNTPLRLDPISTSPGPLFELGGSQSSNTPSPTADLIFSNANSPGEFLRDHSHVTSREPSTDLTAHNSKPSTADVDQWTMFTTPEAVYVPHSPASTSSTASSAPEMATVTLHADKTKTRAETQIKVNLILDPLDPKFEFISFPRQTMAKPKLLCSPEEIEEFNAKGDTVHMTLMLVCATAIDPPEKREQALRRARGDEEIPRRPEGMSLGEVDKDDPSHPQNGGEVLICDGCKERERKRYDRKKKKADDELEWLGFEAQRVIMINDKEYKKLKEVDSSQDQMYSARAKQVEFAMRIACYCRHQEEKAPMGYRVIFTFKDGANHLVAQYVSDVFQITDDHKNKDMSSDMPPAAAMGHFVPQAHYVPSSVGMPPAYQFTQHAPGMYSQPQTPSMPVFPVAMSPIETQFSQPTTPSTLPLRQQAFAPSSTTAVPLRYPRQMPLQRYDVPMTSPTAQINPEAAAYMPRPVSMESFNFAGNNNNNNNFSPTYQYQSQGFSSAPHSAVSTPLNLSRPASPTWEQGPSQRRFQAPYHF